MSPIGSYVGGLTSKGQVGVLLGEHRGWILRMAALIKGRLSDNRPEACGLSFRLKELRTFACFPMHKRQVGGKREEVGGRFASRICTRVKTYEAFQKKWKVSFSYVLCKGKNQKVALKEFMQHVSLSGEREGP